MAFPPPKRLQKQKATVTAEELDHRFDEGEDIGEFLDWDKATRPPASPRPCRFAKLDDVRTR